MKDARHKFIMDKVQEHSVLGGNFPRLDRKIQLIAKQPAASNDIPSGNLTTGPSGSSQSIADFYRNYHDYNI